MSDTETYTARGRRIYTMRLGTRERRLIEAAAAARSVSLAEYIRRAAMTAAREELMADREPTS